MRSVSVSSEGLYIDHVIYGVMDIEAAAARLKEEHGLHAIPGGLHLGGTTNMFVPLRPPLFLELLGVGDPGKADGAWLSQVLNGQDRPLWWVLGVDSLEESAARRGLTIQQGQGETADGIPVSFRSAGMARFPLPFFIDYPVDPAKRRANWEERLRRADHANTPGGFTFVEVGEPPELLDAWLGDHGLPVRHASGPTGIRAVGIETERGEVVIR
jgi:hypothetical protein